MELTKAEEQILHYLWKLGEATVQDILSCMEETGRPSRTTGRGYIYYSLIKKEEYSRKQLFGFISRYFDNSFASLTSFFAKESNLTVDELDVLLAEAKQKLEEEKGKE